MRAPVVRALTACLCLAGLTAAGSASYTVRPGDTLSAIAARHGTSVGSLADANAIADPDRIVAGQTIRVSGTGAPADTARAHTGWPVRLRESPERRRLVPVFERWAAANSIPADLLMAISWLESGWQAGVVSSKGAVGIGQLMPATVDFTRDVLIGAPGLDPRNPEDNIRMSARYLRWLLARADGDIPLALAGYYQGFRSVEVRGVLPVTTAYVESVQALRLRFAG